ncbi:MAG: TrmB family transcriptional regulator [Candidatus Bathyarchaeia archaeon]|jgi:sugar-specific transcriptional regulator TrmB
MEDFSVFVQLGLTEQQARVYLAISRLGQATIKTTAVAAQTARAEVYRVMPELQKLGLIKKIISNPIALIAVPPSVGLEILLDIDAENHQVKKSKAEQFVKNFDTKDYEFNPNINQYFLTTGEGAVVRDFLKEMRELKTSTDGIFEWDEFLYVFKRHYGEYRKVLERGVKIRRITDKPLDQEIPEFIQALKEKGNFEIRYSPRKPKSGIDIWDGKFACIITLPNGRREMEVLNLWNRAILEFINDYFEMKWQAATPC